MKTPYPNTHPHTLLCFSKQPKQPVRTKKERRKMEHHKALCVTPLALDVQTRHPCGIQSRTAAARYYFSTEST